MDIFLNYDLLYERLSKGEYFINIFIDMSNISGNPYTNMDAYIWMNNALRYFEEKNEYEKCNLIKENIYFFNNGHIIDKNIDDYVFNYKDSFYLPQNIDEAIKETIDAFLYIDKDNYQQIYNGIINSSFNVVLSHIYVEYFSYIIKYFCLNKDYDNHVVRYFKSLKITNDKEMAYNLLKMSLKKMVNI